MKKLLLLLLLIPNLVMAEATLLLCSSTDFRVSYLSGENLFTPTENSKITIEFDELNQKLSFDNFNVMAGCMGNISRQALKIENETVKFTNDYIRYTCTVKNNKSPKSNKSYFSINRITGEFNWTDFTTVDDTKPEESRMMQIGEGKCVKTNRAF